MVFLGSFGYGLDGFFCRRHLFGTDEHGHALAEQLGHLFYLAYFFKVVGKAEQEHFALVFEDDATAAEEDVGFYFVAFFKELAGVLELEVVVVVVGLGAEAYFLDAYLDLLGFDFFLPLFLLV